MSASIAHIKFWGYCKDCLKFPGMSALDVVSLEHNAAQEFIFGRNIFDQRNKGLMYAERKSK